MKCCICGAVRNVEKYLDKIFRNMEKIGSLFTEYTIILCYDQSRDNTLGKIKDYQNKNPRLNLIINPELISKYRTHRLAFARNKCLDMIRTNYNDYEMFIMMDCDEVCSGHLNLNILRKNLYKNNWDALSFNKVHYYDIWALSIKPFIFSYLHFQPDAYTKMLNYINTILRFTPKNKLITCASAFNGFSIYRTTKFLNCEYDGTIRLDLIPKYCLKKNIAICRSKIVYKPSVINRVFPKFEDCEHRSFHMQAINKNKSRIRISPEILFL